MNIADLIISETAQMGPFELSGGVIHKVTPEIAQHVADGIARAQDAFRVPAALMCAVLRGESRFDPDAFDPNLQRAPGATDIKGGTWPDDASAAKHTDYGLAQVNGDMTYLGVEAIGKSLQYLCQMLVDDILWAALHGLPVEVALQAYNQGRTGAMTTYAQGGLKACAYGRLVKSRYDDYKTRVI